jgi:ribosomal protein S18 acetylase RimI-like enzyme
MENDLAMYMDFRKVIEEFCYPLLKEWSGEGYVEIKDGDDVVGFMMVLDNYYVNALYVKPDSRRKGLAKRAVLDYIKQGGKITQLHIVKTNKVALKFWKSIFKLRKVDESPVDILYEIKGMKESKNK